MQKLNLNHIPEAPENKDFWVVGTANREGSIDSNSYKKNLAKIGGSLEDMTANMTTEQKMQARKNLGLYYEGNGINKKAAQYVDQPYSEGDTYVKLSDDTPSKEDIISVAALGGQEFPVDGTLLSFVDHEGGYFIQETNSDSSNLVYYNIILSGDNAGIYMRAVLLGAGATLYYNGEVSDAAYNKIDRKFLPDFGSWSKVTLLKELPNYWTRFSAITDYLSEEDIETVLREGMAIATLSANGGYKKYIVLATAYLADSEEQITFYGPDGGKWCIQRGYWGTENDPSWQSSGKYPSLRQMVSTRSGMSKNDMLSLGFTEMLLTRIFYGEISTLQFAPSGSDIDSNWGIVYSQGNFYHVYSSPWKIIVGTLQEKLITFTWDGSSGKITIEKIDS